MTGTPAYSRGLMVREFTAAGQELFERLDLDTEFAEVVPGDPAQEIAAKAESIEPDFVLLGSRGHGALSGAILGSVTRALADERRWPLLIVSDSNDPARQGAVVSGVTTPLEDAVLVARAAERLARRLGKPLVLAHVTTSDDTRAPVHAGGFAAAAGGVLPTGPLDKADESGASRFLDAVASRLQGETEVRKEILVGSPATALEELAAHERAEAIVVGRRGLGAVRSAIKGSVSLDLVRDADCPIMVVPGSAAA
jgi:nucleotide-binding universal stress UspA family protein